MAGRVQVAEPEAMHRSGDPQSGRVKQRLILDGKYDGVYIID